MDESCGLKFQISYVYVRFFLKIPSCAHHVIFITEFALLIKTPPSYEVRGHSTTTWRRGQDEGWGVKKCLFSSTLRVSKLSTQGVKKWQNSVHVVVEWPLSVVLSCLRVLSVPVDLMSMFFYSKPATFFSPPWQRICLSPLIRSREKKFYTIVVVLIKDVYKNGRNTRF